MNSPSAHSPPPSFLRRAGFTILEILIAIVILVIGITGIVALFPTAIESGNKTVEDSYAAAITQSVIDAIAVGLRESKYTYQANGQLFHYFILDHDGVLDAKMADSKVGDYNATNPTTGTLWDKDYTILLPRAKVPDNAVTDAEPWFTFPTCKKDSLAGVTLAIGDEPRQPSQLGSADPIDDLAVVPGDPAKTMKKSTSRGSSEFWYRRVFPLGRYRDDDPFVVSTGGATSPWRGAIRKEFLGALMTGASGGDVPDNYTLVDPYPQYSFAIAIQRAKIDNAGPSSGPPDGKIDVNDKFSDSLYQVRIVIFRNFERAGDTHKNIEGGRPIPKNNIPIREFITLMSI